MNQTQSSNLLKSLLEQDPKQVTAWLDLVLSRQKDLPEEFNWLGFAELSASKARQFTKEKSEFHFLSLDWAKISIAVYQFLAENNPENAELYLDSIMNLKMFMILNFEVTENHSVLDINDIVKWVYQDLKLSPQEALKKSSGWKEALTKTNTEETQVAFEEKLEEIRILRQIKTKIKKLKILVENGKLDPDENTLSWLSVWNQLP